MANQFLSCFRLNVRYNDFVYRCPFVGGDINIIVDIQIT